jgi:8-oxo-dGTP pyrophosphatase MutT (NUDIX family)
MIYHPKLNEHGNKEIINNPSAPTPLATWTNSSVTATAIPDGEMPRELNGIPFSDWSGAPRTNDGWEDLAAQISIDEPPFLPPKHKKHAAGVIVEETDGRVWLVAPSNAHGGYTATFPKGTVDPGASRPATALKEAFEESGLRVEITGFFADSDRSLSFTRYYLARRVGGNPAGMCWESQAVHLVPRAKLETYLTNSKDKPLLGKLLSTLRN